MSIVKGLFRRESTWSKATKPLRRSGVSSAVRSGVTAGATVVALSAASAAASAIRRRTEGS